MLTPNHSINVNGYIILTYITLRSVKPFKFYIVGQISWNQQSQIQRDENTLQTRMQNRTDKSGV